MSGYGRSLRVTVEDPSTSVKSVLCISEPTLERDHAIVDPKGNSRPQLPPGTFFFHQGLDQVDRKKVQEGVVGAVMGQLMGLASALRPQNSPAGAAMVDQVGTPLSPQQY